MSSYTFPVEVGHVLTFARAIGESGTDYDPVFTPDLTAPHNNSIAVPPTFVQAGAQYDPDCLLRPHPGRSRPGSPHNRSAASSSMAAGVTGGGGLHAEQHFEYQRPVRVGDLLAVTHSPGRVWQKQGRRGGTLRFSEQIAEYRDREGHLVVTARSVGVRTDRAAGVAQPGAQPPAPDRIPVREDGGSSRRRATVEVGERRSALLVEGLTRTQIVMYAGASGDYNPVHIDEVYATTRGGYASVFAHGMLTMAMTGTTLTEWFGRDRITAYRARFAALVFPDDTLTATATVTALRTRRGLRWPTSTSLPATSATKR